MTLVVYSCCPCTSPAGGLAVSGDNGSTANWQQCTYALSLLPCALQEHCRTQTLSADTSAAYVVLLSTH
jgi:hypothetical protein